MSSRILQTNVFRQLSTNNSSISCFKITFQTINDVDNEQKSKLFIFVVTIIFDISTKNFVEKTIYFTSIEFLSMTKTINFVVQTIIDRSINTMFVKMQNMINQIRVQFSTFSFFSFNSFENDTTTNNNFFNSRFILKKNWIFSISNMK